MPSYLRPHTEYMSLEHIHIDASATYPDFLQGMVDAARSDGDIATAIDSTVRGLGFNTFMYGCAASWRPNCESKMWAFTTLPVEWVREYEKNAYMEVDVRIQGLFTSSIPVIWDQSERGRASAGPSSSPPHRATGREAAFRCKSRTAHFSAA